jgi:hypothetical protein
MFREKSFAEKMNCSKCFVGQCFRTGKACGEKTCPLKAKEGEQLRTTGRGQNEFVGNTD